MHGTLYICKRKLKFGHFFSRWGNYIRRSYTKTFDSMSGGRNNLQKIKDDNCLPTQNVRFQKIRKLEENIWKLKSRRVPLWKFRGLPYHSSLLLSGSTECLRKAYFIYLVVLCIHLPPTHYILKNLNKCSHTKYYFVIVTKECGFITVSDQGSQTRGWPIHLTRHSLIPF